MGYNFGSHCAKQGKPMIVFNNNTNSDICAAIARKFLQHGHKMIVATRPAQPSPWLQALAAEAGSALLPLEIDLGRRTEIDAALAQLPAEWRAIDVLVNQLEHAPGTGAAGAVADWDQMIDHDCRSLVTLTHALLPAMIARGSGLVINLDAGDATGPDPSIAAASGAFVAHFTLNLRADLVGTGVRNTHIGAGLQRRQSGDSAGPVSSADIAANVYWLATLPAHVNINRLELEQLA